MRTLKMTGTAASAAPVIFTHDGGERKQSHDKGASACSLTFALAFLLLPSSAGKICF
jgi:hypothetical protein